MRIFRGRVSMIRILMGAMALGTAIGILVAAPRGSLAEAAGKPCEVLIVADSLVVKSPQTYIDVLRAAGWEPRIVAEAGQSTPWGFRALRRLLDDDSAGVPPTVVVALGTNDTRGARFGFGAMRTRVGQYRQLLGPERRLLWVDVVLWDQARTLPVERFARISEVNRALAVVAGRGRISLVPWAQRALEQPELVFRPDGVHYLPEGYRLRAETIAATLGPAPCVAPPR